jgi:hypothetical protein
MRLVTYFRLNGLLLSCSCLLLPPLSGCASRGYGGEQAGHGNSVSGSGQFQADLALAAALAAQPQPKVTAVRGNAIHESENKQPAYLNQLLTRILSESVASDSANLNFSTRKPDLLPALERPVDGYSSTIGREDYLGRAAGVLGAPSAAAVSGVSSVAEASSDGEQRTELRERWKDVAKASAKGDSPALAALIREYFSSSQLRASSSPGFVDFSVIVPSGVFEEVGYWNRPDGSGATKSESDAKQQLKGMSIGERVMARNRAMILMEIGSIRTKASNRSAAKLRESIGALAAGESQDKLIWARTHIVLTPSKKSELAVALGKLSVLGYSFAQISDLNDTGFRLRIISYQFAYAVPSWDGAMTAQVLDSLCLSRPHRTRSSPKECEALLASSAKLGSPALGEFAVGRMAKPFEIRGYSPAIVTDEVVSSETLQGESVLVQTQIVDQFPGFGGL